MYIQTQWQWLTRKSGAVQFLAQGHIDKQTRELNNLLITRCWLYPWATTTLNTQHYPHVRKDHFSSMCYYTVSLSYKITKMYVVSCNDGAKATLIMISRNNNIVLFRCCCWTAVQTDSINNVLSAIWHAGHWLLSNFTQKTHNLVIVK